MILRESPKILFFIAMHSIAIMFITPCFGTQAKTVVFKAKTLQP